MHRFLTVIAALLVSVSATAQEELPFQKTWSIELGTGIYPLYMNFVPSRALETELADKGQQIYNKSYALVSSVTVAGVYRISRRSEINATAQLNWRSYQIRQYPVFGTDPNGKDRYDLNQKATYVGDGVVFVPAFTIRGRYLYNPDDLLKAYSGVGLGIAFNLAAINSTFSVFPEITPIGLRFGRDHFYVFAEDTIGNVATLVHGGLGWKF